MFAPCFSLLEPKLPSPQRVRVSARSALVVSGRDVVIEALELDGALEVTVEEGGSLRVLDLRVANRGWEFVEHTDEEQAVAEETAAIRGYRLVKHETRRIHVRAGEHLRL